MSSAMVNVLWGLFNLAIAYLLVCRVGAFNLRKTQHVLALGTGILLMSLMLWLLVAGVNEQRWKERASPAID